MEAWWEIILVFLLSTVKFVFGAVPMALGFGFSFFEAVVVTSVGGFVGVLIFTFMSDKIVHALKKRRERKLSENPQMVKGKKFSKRNRMIVKVKRRFGLIGISVLTPLLFSIPLGCFLSVRYFKNKQKIIAYMFASILFWSFTISSFKLLFP